jgi:oligopeptidase B
LSLINRGVIYAIAHVRGGSELGRHWYEDGKLLDKKNTFTDFIACARHLASEGLTSADQILAYGGSAGGLLLGAVANMAPDDFGTIVAEVPFVDVLRVMLDPTLPLTTFEYVEWGNPEEDEYYEYIKSYSPYDNVIAQAYPALMITAGINDDQVPYWQPAKWTAKLRDTKTDNRVLILRTNMGAGHGGASARDEEYGEVAELYAFMLGQLVPEAVSATPVANRRAAAHAGGQAPSGVRRAARPGPQAQAQARVRAGRHPSRRTDA